MVFKPDLLPMALIIPADLDPLPYRRIDLGEQGPEIFSIKRRERGARIKHGSQLTVADQIAVTTDR